MESNAVRLHTERVDGALSITPQLEAQDMEAAAAQGYRSIINNRPDFEGGPGQPRSAELEAAARAAGLQYRHLPVPPSGHSDADARRMADLVDSLPKPVLAFCRSGRRSAALYQKGRSAARDSRG
ncbi:MAG: protein tyrosine phosphatase family protein [Ramlibacter sp.]